MSFAADTLEQIETLRDAVALFSKVLVRVAQPKKWRPREIALHIVQMGLGSLPIITLSTAVAGTVVTKEIAWHMDAALHSVSMIPGFAAQFILRELGIAVPALLLVAKVGAATTAEVGTMTITEQVDALKLLGIDPIDYLVVPRFVAALFSSACLTLVSVSVTLICALLVAVVSYGFSTLEFINALRHFVGLQDLVCALVKGCVYGAVIPIISCTYGFRCKRGAEGVGTATTQSVVTSTILVICFDFLLTYLFTWIL